MKLDTFLAICAFPGVMASSPPEVKTSFGSVVGGLSTYRHGVEVFKGIPFAAPPVGPLRWAAPQAPSVWSGVLNATSFAPDCPQTMGSTSMSEDCLYLNIWRPKNTKPHDRLPVYLWIFGGGFNSGSSSNVMYDGSGFAALDVIYVNFNYRLGPLGFLAHPDLSAESGHNASGNYGVMDMIAALDWVHSEIAAFGGDPDQITVGGESAGSAGSLDMMWSPLTEKKAAGIISESGALGTRDPFTVTAATSYRTKAAAEAFGVEFASQMNTSSIAELRDLPVSALMTEDNVSDTILEESIYANVSGFGNPPEWRPVIDGYVLPMGYEEALLGKAHWDIPVLTGNNKDEDGASTDPRLTLDEYRTQFALMFGDMSDEFFELYPAGNNTAAGDAANELWRDMTRLGMWDWARDWRRGVAKSSVYTYFFTHAPPNQTGGAYHGSELYYVFNNIPYTDNSKTWTSEEYAIGDTMVAYWVNFIKTRNPNGHGLAHWPANNEEKSIMFLGDSWGKEPVASKARITFLQKFFETQEAW